MGLLSSHLSLLLLLVSISNAAELTGRDYWNSVLPKTSMPNAINLLLDSGRKRASETQFHPDTKVIYNRKEGASETQFHPDTKVVYNRKEDASETQFHPDTKVVYNRKEGASETQFHPDTKVVYNRKEGASETQFHPATKVVYNRKEGARETQFHPDTKVIYNRKKGVSETQFHPDTKVVYNRKESASETQFHPDTKVVYNRKKGASETQFHPDTKVVYNRKEGASETQFHPDTKIIYNRKEGAGETQFHPDTKILYNRKEGASETQFHPDTKVVYNRKEDASETQFHPDTKILYNHKEGASETQFHPNTKVVYNRKEGASEAEFTKVLYNHKEGASENQFTKVLFNRKDGASDNIDPNDAIFFLEQDLHSGKRMIQDLTPISPNAPTFIPRSVANKLPFSSPKLSDILNHFKIADDSIEADMIKQTLSDCEYPAAEGEKKYCPTSLESMVDFATSSLKTHDLRSLSTNVNPQNAPKQEYMIIKSKLLARNELVVCHMQTFAYAVFYCHKIKSTVAYMVNLVGKGGDQAAAIAVCHEDTSSWNPNHLAFQILKVQPGTVPICHFLVPSTVAWIRDV